jgi:hypothetical protein
MLIAALKFPSACAALWLGKHSHHLRIKSPPLSAFYLLE